MTNPCCSLSCRRKRYDGRGVLQHGSTALISLTQPVTCFDHSVGVMLLVRRVGGSLEEQLAAVLHDVSHTAFSHVIDYVVAGHDSQSYHEGWKESYLAASDVPEVLTQQLRNQKPNQGFR